MTVGVVAVGRLCRQLKADKGYNAGAHIREVIETVGNKRHSARQKPDGNFKGAEQRIAEYSCSAAQISVAAADTDVVDITFFGKKADKQPRHGVFAPLAPFAPKVAPFKISVSIVKLSCSRFLWRRKAVSTSRSISAG